MSGLKAGVVRGKATHYFKRKLNSTGFREPKGTGHAQLRWQCRWASQAARKSGTKSPLLCVPALVQQREGQGCLQLALVFLGKKTITTQGLRHLRGAETSLGIFGLRTEAAGDAKDAGRSVLRDWRTKTHGPALPKDL
ncbi:uncharacterized protein LOC123516253 [Portunus trituberculatus]|uniref:uncharacterized protein LOC123516253 n=1 Tax=Portunus trituberculatus TaxID=210409 RepID=UPI001E1CFA94|nr:uncharacterized protein LOC123516253 [Portunus trituberculatus]